MDWLVEIVLRFDDFGWWGPLLFIGLYAAATVLLAPAFVLSVTAGALFGVWRGSVIVFAGATLGASAAYGVARRLARSRLLRWLDRDPRVAAVRMAVAGEGVWVQFLLRLSPIVPFNLLNYALGLSGVQFRGFLIAMIGMLPAIVMYVYYGKVVGDVAALAAGVAPPRGVEYYVLLGIGLVATVIATTAITRSARKAMKQVKTSNFKVEK